MLETPGMNIRPSRDGLYVGSGPQPDGTPVDGANVGPVVVTPGAGPDLPPPDGTTAILPLGEAGAGGTGTAAVAPGGPDAARPAVAPLAGDADPPGDRGSAASGRIIHGFEGGAAGRSAPGSAILGEHARGPALPEAPASRPDGAPGLGAPSDSEALRIASASHATTAAVPSGSDATPPPVTLTIGNAGGFVINVTFDSSVTSQPNATTIEAAFNDAISYFTGTFANNVTDNITVHWGSSSLGSSSTEIFEGFTYSQVRSAFLGLGNQSANQLLAYGALPTGDPLPNGPNEYDMSTAEAKALGLGSFSGTDGTVSFSSGVSYTFDPNNRAVAGEFDFIGVAEHEISEVLGRIANVGDAGLSGGYMPIDLFRWSGAGTRQTSATGTPSYFSINSGITDLKDWNNHSGTGLNNGGDLGDWLNTSPYTADAFNDSAASGIANPVTSVDTELLNILGYQIACFCDGTRILTEHGEVPVDQLAIGDRVATWSGALRPIKWIGRRSYGGRFIRGNLNVLPVIVKAGALADGVPRRDLFLSPLHALLLDGVLVPAECLVNGRSIVGCQAAETVAYVHIELDSHDVIFAEGAAAETFVDCDSRGMFQNAHEFAELYPGDEPTCWAFCAPRLDDGPALGRLWRKLAERAGIASAMEGNRSGPAMLQGHLDRADREVISGWARDGGHPDHPVALKIVIDGTLAGQVTAYRFRQDVAAAGYGTGRHGFQFATPPDLSRDCPHMIAVVSEADGVAVAGSPLILEAGPCRLDGSMRLSLGRAVADEAAAAERAAALDPAIDLLLTQAAKLVNRKAELRGQAAGDRASRRRALFIDDCVPVTGRDAGSQAAIEQMRTLLRLGYAVTFASVAACEEPGALRHLQGLGVRCGAPSGADSVEEVFIKAAEPFDIVYLHRYPVAARHIGMARRYCPSARIIYSLADLHFLRTAREAAVEGRPDLLAESAQTKAAELAAIGAADAVVTHSSHEAAVLAREAPAAEVHVVPWPVEARPRRVPASARNGVAFIGNFRHRPNFDAATWLAEEIMPLVWQRDPTISCLLAGSDMPDAVFRLARPGIVSLGHVEDLDTLFDRVRLTVAPLRYGAGIKAKVVDSLAAGLPCVLTPIAAEGLDLPPLLSECIGRDKAEIAELICRLNAGADEYERCAAAGLRYVREKLSMPRIDRLTRAAVAPQHGQMPRLAALSA
jgi:glycosyltransferase involved in cell wall biosynthesis